MKHRVYTVSV